MMYRDRNDAAERLADALEQWQGAHPLVIAIPRGAVPMGRIVAERLGGDLDIVLVRKLHAPGNPEFAIGAVDETGWTYLADYAPLTGASREYIDREAYAESATIRRRRALYTPHRAPMSVRGRVVIVVDDGLATGATMIAALHAIRAREPKRLICAVPVGSPESVARVRGYADEVVCLQSPEYFHAVAQFYRLFPQVSDDEVVALLARRAAAARSPPQAEPPNPESPKPDPSKPEAPQEE
jgi:predicted phosphoribosyltransferase